MMLAVEAFVHKIYGSRVLFFFQDIFEKRLFGAHPEDRMGSNRCIKLYFK